MFFSLYKSKKGGSKGGNVTHDERFESGYAEFQALAGEMMEIGASTHVFWEQAKTWTTTGQQVGSNVNDYFSRARSDFTSVTKEYLQANERVGNTIRKSVVVVLLEQSLNPLRKFCSEKIPEIEARVALRNRLRDEYDSAKYKHESAKRNLGQNQIDKSKVEVDAAKRQYERINTELIDEFTSLKASKDDLLMNQASALMICQREFLRRTAQELDGAIRRIPETTRRKTENSIEQVMRSGGPDPTMTAACMELNRQSFQIKAPVAVDDKFQGRRAATNGTVPTSLQQYPSAAPTKNAYGTNPPKPTPPPSLVDGLQQYPKPSQIAGKTGGGGAPQQYTKPLQQTAGKTPPTGGVSLLLPQNAKGNVASKTKNFRPPTTLPVPKNAHQQTKRAPPPAPPPPVPLQSPARKKIYAVADYSFDARDETEISLEVGESVEVMNRDDSGWWVGVNGSGETGQFPANYVSLKQDSPFS